VVRTNCARGDAAFPPVIVYFDGDDLWLADGFHCYHAYRAAGVDKELAEVRTGTLRDVVLYSVRANAVHGLRRSNRCNRTTQNCFVGIRQSIAPGAQWFAPTARAAMPPARR
jgi:hypothetical protein